MAKNLDMRKGSTTVLVLSMLTEKPMYGYQIAKELAARSEGVFDFKEGTLYPALHRMEKDGLLFSYWEVVQEGPSRKYYTITDKGSDALARRSKDWGDFARAMLRVLEGAKSQCLS
ncbi:MAG: helix-turn-helix transcriptional regulator [Anaerolineae bacterium]|nr:helix-turn-helix transcriptional regulator [Anaerolineae bacterium]